MVDVLHCYYRKESDLMSNTTVTFRTDSELKKEAIQLFESMGMTLSSALNIFLKEAVRTQMFPCSVDSETIDDLGIAVNCRDTYPEGFFDLFGAFPDLEIIDDETMDEGFIAEREEL